jgi:hypothetical protein
MSHFAKVVDDIVTEVIVSEKDFINSGAVGDEFLWVQCSYNDNFRGKFPGINDIYDNEKGIFISPQPYPSWTLDTDNNWQPPIQKPADMNQTWNEDSQTWIETV